MIRTYSLICIFALVVIITGCGIPLKVPEKTLFCWNSDNLISPNERIVEFEGSVVTLSEKFIQWILQNEGQVIAHNKDFHKKITFSPNCEQNFQLAKKIYDTEKDSCLKLRPSLQITDEEFARLKELMSKQILLEESNEPSHKIIANMNKRKHTRSYKVQTGTKKEMVGYKDPYYNHGGGIQGLGVMSFTYLLGCSDVTRPLVDSLSQEVEKPVYETRTEITPFSSEIEIYIYQNDGKTYVYATAKPQCKDTAADYGKTIDFRYLQNSLADYECALVRAILICGKVDVNKVYSDGTTALWKASQIGNSQIVEYLLNKKANVNFALPAGETPLWIASKNGHFDVVKLLLEAGADVNAKACTTKKCYTPLEAARKMKNDQVISLLTEYGATE